MDLENNERVKDVKGFEGFYLVSNFGRVWSCRRKIWIKNCFDVKGYPIATLSVKGKKSTFKIHKLVAIAFVKNLNNKPQVNHKNGVKADCRSTNLEWCTARENLQHATDMGLNKVFKLSKEDKILICKMFSVLKTRKSKIALLFGVTSPAIIYIIQTYSHMLATAA